LYILDDNSEEGESRSLFPIKHCQYDEQQIVYFCIGTTCNKIYFTRACWL